MMMTETEALGDAWLEQGLGEHASVAAFAKFILHLIGLGAPPSLLREAIRAMDDEVNHACLCFEIASRFRGRSASPGPLDLSDVLDHSNDPAAILQAAIVEGCIDETISARGATLASKLADDPSIRRTLAQIAEDESRHADLSWNFVDWTLKTYPFLLPTAETCFAEMRVEAANVQDFADSSPPLEQFGQLSPSTKERVRVQTWADEIIPRMQALLASAAGREKSDGVASCP